MIIKKFINTYSLIALFSLLLLIMACPDLVSAKHKDAKDPIAKVIIDPTTLNLINTLSLHPELMHLEFLQYYIGRPENEAVHRVNLHKHFYWYDNSNHALKYEMEQILQAPFQVTKSTFTAIITDSHINLKQTKSLLGNDFQQFYDEKGIPCTSYSTSPNTQLIFKQPSNAFRITKVSVDYAGPPLPGPSLQFIGFAQDYRLQKLLKNLDNGNPQELITILKSHLSEFPSDAKAHLELAKVYQKTFNLNDAIKEFQTALNCANNDPIITDEADQGLRSLKVLPPQ